jgi:hypothetical protein
MRFGLPVILFLFFSGCSDDGPNSLPDASDAGDAYDAGSDDAGSDAPEDGTAQDADAGDPGIGDEYALLIPAGTRACSDKRSTWDVYGGYLNRMRITFVDGTILLPKDQPPFERDWIASIEYGPDKTLLQPSSAGIFTLTSSAGRDDYDFVQLFSDGALTYTLTYNVWFDPADPNDRLRVFDEPYLSPALTYPQKTIDLTVDRGEFERWYFLTCRHDLYLPVIHRVRTADGAELDLEERYLPSDACMLACPTALVRAEFRLGPDHRLVEDPFRLAFVDGQHNWFDRFLVAFDDPVADIRALHFFPTADQAPQQKVDYLDAALDTIRSSPVTGYTVVELWAAFDSATVPATTCTEYCRDYAGLAEACEPSCIVEGQPLAGRCFPTQSWPPTGDWTDLSSCDATFETCAAAGRPFIQCCCSRIADIW